MKKGEENTSVLKTLPRERILQIVEESGGVIAKIARALGVHRSTVSRWMQKKKWFREAVQEAREQVIDLAELQLFRAVQEGERWAIEFVLKYLGKNRGYSERFELKHSGQTQAFITTVKIVHAKSEGNDNEGSSES